MTRILLFSVILGICVLAFVEGEKAKLTSYCSYPPCCKSKGIKYTKAEKKYCDQDECDDYSGCKKDNMGQFYFCDHLSHDQVIKKHIVSFFSTNGDIQQYAKKTLKITQGSHSIEAIVCDTCSDDDCNGCCSDNADPDSGYLIDMEANTLATFKGKDGTVTWECVDC